MNKKSLIATRSLCFSILFLASLSLNLSPSYAEWTTISHIIHDWVKTCPDLKQDSKECLELKKGADLLSSSKENCDPKEPSEKPPNQELLQFAQDFQDVLHSGAFIKDFKGWNTKQISQLVVCVFNNQKQWKESCLKKSEKRPTCDVSSENDNFANASSKKTLNIDYDESCESIFIDTDVLLGSGGENDIFSSIEFRNNAKPKWTPVAKSIYRITGGEKYKRTPDEEVNEIWKSKTQLNEKAFEKAFLKTWNKEHKTKHSVEELKNLLKPLKKNETTRIDEKELRNEFVRRFLLNRDQPIAAHKIVEGVPGVLQMRDENYRRAYMPRYEGSLTNLLTPSHDPNQSQKNNSPGAFVVPQVLRVLTHTVAEMTKKGIVHRDLKDGNVVVNHSQDAFKVDPKVIDTDSAVRSSEAAESAKVDSPLIGASPGYMPPEFEDADFGGGTVDQKKKHLERREVYSLAITIAKSYGIALPELQILSVCQKEAFERIPRGQRQIYCKAEFEKYREAILKAEHPKDIGNLLHKQINSNPDERDEIAQFKDRFNKITQNQFVSEFKTKIPKLATDLKDAKTKAETDPLGYSIVPFEHISEDSIPTLRLGILKKGSENPVLLETNPFIDQKKFEEEIVQKAEIAIKK